MVDKTLSEKNKLALHGGSPIREKLLPYGPHSVDGVQDSDDYR